MGTNIAYMTHVCKRLIYSSFKKHMSKVQQKHTTCNKYNLTKDFHLFRNDIPTVMLSSWPDSTTMLDEEAATGPVPSLFSEDPEANLRATKANLAHHDIQKPAKLHQSLVVYIMIGAIQQP